MLVHRFENKSGRLQLHGIKDRTMSTLKINGYKIICHRLCEMNNNDNNNNKKKQQQI